MQYNCKINVLRVGKAPDGMMGSVESDRVLHENLPCRINWSRGAEKITFNKRTDYRDAKIYCRVVDVTTKDKVSYRDKTYEILSVSDVDEKERQLVLEIRKVE